VLLQWAVQHTRPHAIAAATHAPKACMLTVRPRLPPLEPRLPHAMFVCWLLLLCGSPVAAAPPAAGAASAPPLAPRREPAAAPAGGAAGCCACGLLMDSCRGGEGAGGTGEVSKAYHYVGVLQEV
jgi:hypothetical protein